MEKEYQLALENKRLEEQRLKAQANFIRTSQIHNFGIYNWDIIFKNNNRIIVKTPNFEFNQPGFSVPDHLYMVTGNGRALINFNSKSSMFFIPDEKNLIVAILAENKIAIFNNENSWNNISQNARNREIESHTFTLSVKDIKSLDDLFANL